MNDRVDKTAIILILEEIEAYGNASSDQDRDDAIFDIAGIVLAAVASIPSDRRGSSFIAYLDTQRLQRKPELAYHDAIRRIVHASEAERLLMLHALVMRRPKPLEVD